MDLNRDKALPCGLYLFRVIVRVAVEEAIIEQTEDGEDMESPQGFYRSYAVTAHSLSDASAIVEEHLRAHRPAGGSTDDPQGSIEMIDTTVMDPASVELEGDDWKRSRGIHYASGRIYFSGDDTLPDNDIAGTQAIYNDIHDTEEEEDDWDTEQDDS